MKEERQEVKVQTQWKMVDHRKIARFKGIKNFEIQEHSKPWRSASKYSKIQWHSKTSLLPVPIPDREFEFRGGMEMEE